MNDRETLEKAAEVLEIYVNFANSPLLHGLATRLREMAKRAPHDGEIYTDNSAVIATLRACLAEMGREASGAQDFYWSVRQRLGMTRDDSALVETVIDQKLARIAELEPLQEVVAQLEDEKRALREALEAWTSAENYPEPSCSAEYDYQSRLYAHARRLTAEALKGEGE